MNELKEFKEVVRLNDLLFYNQNELSKRVLKPFLEAVEVFQPLYDKLRIEPKYSDWKSLMKPIEKELKKGLPDGLVLTEIAKLRDCLLLYRDANTLLEKLNEQDKQNGKFTALIYFDEESNQYQYDAEKLEETILKEATEVTGNELEFYILQYAKRLLQDFDFVKINQQSLNLFYNTYPLYQPNTNNGQLEPSLAHIQAFARRLIRSTKDKEFIEREKNLYSDLDLK